MMTSTPITQPCVVAGAGGSDWLDSQPEFTFYSNYIGTQIGQQKMPVIDPPDAVFWMQIETARSLGPLVDFPKIELVDMSRHIRLVEIGILFFPASG
jgi:hypothetical protein